MSKYVFDTTALITFIEDEPGANTVEDLIVKAIDDKIGIFISVVSLIELFYITVQEQNIEIAIERLDLVKVLPITIVELKTSEIEAIRIYSH